MSDPAKLIAQARGGRMDRRDVLALADALEAENFDSEARRRAMAKVKEGHDGCWIWQGAKTGNGYASIWNPRTQKSEQAHRLFYEWYVGTIPDDLQACHLCDAPLCVNPTHIFLGTQSDNMQDCARKGRFAVQRGMAQRGEAHGSAKLTEDDVRAIRICLRGGFSQRQLAERFGVNKGTIHKISAGKLWSHVS